MTRKQEGADSIIRDMPLFFMLVVACFIIKKESLNKIKSITPKGELLCCCTKDPAAISDFVFPGMEPLCKQVSFLDWEISIQTLVTGSTKLVIYLVFCGHQVLNNYISNVHLYIAKAPLDQFEETFFIYSLIHGLEPFLRVKNLSPSEFLYYCLKIP